MPNRELNVCWTAPKPFSYIVFLNKEAVNANENNSQIIVHKGLRPSFTLSLDKICECARPTTKGYLLQAEIDLSLDGQTLSTVLFNLNLCF